MRRLLAVQAPNVVKEHLLFAGDDLFIVLLDIIMHRWRAEASGQRH
jgi:hypothetical protein